MYAVYNLLLPSPPPVHPLAHACAHRGQCKQCVKLLFEPLLRTSTLPFRNGESFQANYPRVQHRGAFREGQRAPILVIFLLGRAATRNKYTVRACSSGTSCVIEMTIFETLIVVFAALAIACSSLFFYGI